MTRSNPHPPQPVKGTQTWRPYYEAWAKQGRTVEQKWAVENFLTGQGAKMFTTKEAKGKVKCPVCGIVTGGYAHSCQGPTPQRPGQPREWQDEFERLVMQYESDSGEYLPAALHGEIKDFISQVCDQAVAAERLRLRKEIEGKREELAELAHGQWSGWMEYLFSKCKGRQDGPMIIPQWAVERWSRQLRTPYADLPEEEKESDRTEADKYLAILTLTTTDGKEGIDKRDSEE